MTVTVIVFVIGEFNLVVSVEVFANVRCAFVLMRRRRVQVAWLKIFVRTYQRLYLLVVRQFFD